MSAGFFLPSSKTFASFAERIQTSEPRWPLSSSKEEGRVESLCEAASAAATAVEVFAVYLGQRPDCINRAFLQG